MILCCAKLCQNIAVIIGGNCLSASFSFNVPGLVVFFNEENTGLIIPCI